MHTPVRRGALPAALLALGAGTLLAVASPLAASAHVSLQDNQANPGSTVVLGFQVPTEGDTTTDRVTVSLPTDHPLLDVRFVPLAGWTATTTTEQLPKPVVNGDDTITRAVTKVTWTAQPGQGVPADGLGLFQLRVGPIPSVGSIPLPVEQGYGDGTTASWSGTGDHAADPAPVLYVNDAPPADAHTSHGSSVPLTSTPVEHDATQPDVVARVFGVAGVVVGAVGVVLAVASLTSRRRAAKADQP